MAVTKMEQGTGRSRSKLNNKQVKAARDREAAAIASQRSSASSRSAAPSSRPSGLSPILPIPAFGGGDQMKRNTDAIRSALGGRKAPTRAKPNSVGPDVPRGNRTPKVKLPLRAVNGVNDTRGVRASEDGKPASRGGSARGRSVLSRASGATRGDWMKQAKRR